MTKRKTALGLCVAIMLGALMVVPANSQISVDQLNPASVYDAGVIHNRGLGGGLAGGLDSTLWQGVSAIRAVSLIENMDANAVGSALVLNRAALLSGGVPPRAADNFARETYLAARLSAVLALGNFSDFDVLVNQSDINRANPAYTKIFTERALLGADIQTACAITDNVTIERKSPYWAQLRAFCHVVRGEIPAAELTSDLLARSGHENKAFFALLGKLTGTRLEIKLDSMETPLQIAMAREVLKTDDLSVKNSPLVFTAQTALDANEAPAVRLAALLSSAHLLDMRQIRLVMADLTDLPLGPAEILAQADKQGQLAGFARALEAEIRQIPLAGLANSNALLFARAAVAQNDTTALRTIFQALDANNPVRMRIALAADALNNGFVLGELGIDIEGRLAGDEKTQARAVRDSFIAVAMGANLSFEAEAILRRTKHKGRAINSGELLALQAAARRGSKAEVALRAALIIDGDPLRADAFATLLATFISVGMHEQAGRLAALDILDVE